jgi:hypothetical protein
MAISLNLYEGAGDDYRLSCSVLDDMNQKFRIEILDFTENYLRDSEMNEVLGVWLKYGVDESYNQLMFKANLDEMELFASTILKKIEMIRRDYSQELKNRK